MIISPDRTVAALARPDDARWDRVHEIAPGLGPASLVEDDPATSTCVGPLTTRQAAALRAWARLEGPDLLVRPDLDPATRRLVVLDVDSTLIDQEVIDLLAEEAGCGDQVAGITDRAMAGELDFAGSLTARVALLAGLDVTALDRARARMRPTAGAQAMVQRLQAAGHRVAAVSGGFTAFTDVLAADLGLDRAHANTLEVRDGRLTGRVVGEIVGPEVKARTLATWAGAYGITMPATVAVGDGANDLSMITAAGVGVAFCARPILQEAADAVVRVRRLDAIPALLGISRPLPLGSLHHD